MTDAELREKLAAIEHQRWADWQTYMHSLGYRTKEGETLILAGTRMSQGVVPGSLILPADRVAQWDRQIATPYADLTEREQASDMEQVDRYWPLIVDWKGRG